MPLREPVPDLDALDLLVSIGELGSISAAAQAHQISQPAASMRIRRLEAALGLELLERRASGSRLTANGSTVLEWATSIVNGIQALQVTSAALRPQGKPELRIAASFTVAEYLVPTWLRELERTRPGDAVLLSMGNSSEVVRQVRDGEVELGFIEGVSAPSGLVSRDLLSDDLVVVVGASHPWVTRRRPVSVASFLQAKLISREPGSGTREVLEATLSQLGHGKAGSGPVEMASTTAIKAAVASGAGVAVLSRRTIESELVAGTLSVIAVDGLQLRRMLRAVWQKSHKLSAGATQLLTLASASRRSPTA